MSLLTAPLRPWDIIATNGSLCESSESESRIVSHQLYRGRRGGTRGLPLITYAPREGGGGQSLLYISIACKIHAKKGGGGRGSRSLLYLL